MIKLETSVMRDIFSLFAACMIMLWINPAKGQSTRVEGQSVSSPNGNITAAVWMSKHGRAMYSIAYRGQALLDSSALGAELATVNLRAGLTLVGDLPTETIDVAYEVSTSKRKHNHYQANSKLYQFRNAANNGFDVTFQVSNDGVAFRYHFPDSQANGFVINEELTSFRFPAHAKAWLQPVAAAKSGWEQTNPSYEEHYQQGIPVGTPEPTGTGWIYPALFQVDSTWLLITEAGLDGRYHRWFSR